MDPSKGRTRSQFGGYCGQTHSYHVRAARRGTTYPKTPAGITVEIKAFNLAISDSKDATFSTKCKSGPLFSSGFGELGRPGSVLGPHSSAVRPVFSQVIHARDW